MERLSEEMQTALIFAIQVCYENRELQKQVDALVADRSGYMALNNQLAQKVNLLEEELEECRNGEQDLISKIQRLMERVIS